MKSLGQFRWTNNNPSIYINLYYESRRVNADMQYRIKASLSTVSGSSYFGYPIYLKASFDNVEKINTTMKNASPSQWSSNIEYTSDWITVSNKISGATALSVNLNTGSYNIRNENYAFGLEVAPAYANITKFEVLKRDETSVFINYSVNETCDLIQISKDDGASFASLASDRVVSGLSANTSYKFRLRVRRKDSQLLTTSDLCVQTTYDYPYCTNAPAFVIGNNFTIGLYNPLNRKCQVSILGNNDTIICTKNDVASTTVTNFNSSEIINNLYKSIPNAQSSTYKVRVVYGNVTKTVSTTNKYSCDANSCKPIFKSENINYYDDNSKTIAITNNNKEIIQFKSVLKVQPTATAKNSASIVSYDATFGGVNRVGTGILNFGNVGISRTENITITATDSRGFKTTATKEIKVTEYDSPSAILTAYRKNNWENESYFKCDVKYSSLNGKNSIQIKYGFAKGATSSPTATKSINNNVVATETLDNQSEWKFIVQITDLLETTTSYIILPKGVFIEFWDRKKLSVGINGFPKHDKSLEVFGTIYENDKKIDDLFYKKNIVLNNVDFNSLKSNGTGLFIMNGYCKNNPQYITTNAVWYVLQFVYDNDATQIVFCTDAIPQAFMRSSINGTWKDWAEFRYWLG